MAVERRANRLALVPSMDPPLLAALIARLLVDARGPIVRRFLEVTGIAHRDGVIDAAGIAAGRCEPGRLASAVRAVTAEFPPLDVAPFLDALHAQRIPFLEGLGAARRAPEAPVPPAGMP